MGRPDIKPLVWQLNPKTDNDDSLSCKNPRFAGAIQVGEAVVRWRLE
jgi:hypothetical protein